MVLGLEIAGLVQDRFELDGVREGEDAGRVEEEEALSNWPENDVKAPFYPEQHNCLLI